jgi:hypothetical protein
MANLESSINRLHCRDTNFISIAVYIITNQPFTNNTDVDRRELKNFIDNRSGKEKAVIGSGLGIKTKRKTRKLRKTRKHKK